jgi:hypothetical protein
MIKMRVWMEVSDFESRFEIWVSFGWTSGVKRRREQQERGEQRDGPMLTWKCRCSDVESEWSEWGWKEKPH